MRKFILWICLLGFISCAKEIYTDEDAANAKREAQKVGLTVLIRDMNHPDTDMSNFVISAIQYEERVSRTTLSDGCVDLMLIKGDVILTVKKEGYPETTAIVSLPSSGSVNSVVVIPVFSENQMTGLIEGKVSSDLIANPIPDVLVRIDVDIDNLITSVFSGLGKELSKYRPQAVSYSFKSLMQPFKTNAQGVFSFKIPVTPTELMYTIRVHEIKIGDTLYSGSKEVKTNGRGTSLIDIPLHPSEQ